MARLWWHRRDRRAESVEAEQQRLRDERAVLALQYRQTFGTPHGQEVLADILRRGGVMQSTFDANPTTAAFHEGKRRLALEIIEMMNASPAERAQLALTGETETLFPPPKEE